MTRGTFLSGGAAFALGFGISKATGGKTKIALLWGVGAMILVGATFEWVIAPIIISKANKAALDSFKNMNQAQADALAAQAKSEMFPSKRDEIISYLAIGNYTYQDGKAIKNK